MLFEKGEGQPLYPVVLLDWELRRVVKLPVDSLPPGESAEVLPGLEESSGAVVEHLLGVPGCLDGLKSAEVFPLLFLQPEEDDAALLLLAGDCFPELV